MFYLITFINIVRWCTLRTYPKRETRGVSRSKCADLITACLPVSWAISIIISETVDATDYYDGFGTGEIVIGIRAYQWGWEYFYPKNIDLNYNIKPSYSVFMGNSLKYSNTSSEVLKSNSLWKFYQNTSSNTLSTTPASTLLSPNDSINNLNLIDFSNIGANTLADSMAFKKIQNFSKLTPQFIHLQSNTYHAKFDKINNLYLNESTLDTINAPVSILRQHNYASLKTSLTTFSTLIDNSSFKKFFKYTTSLDTKNFQQTLDYNYMNAYKFPFMFPNSHRLQQLTSLFSKTSKLNFKHYLHTNHFTSQTNQFIDPSNPFKSYFNTNKVSPYFLDKIR